MNPKGIGAIILYVLLGLVILVVILGVPLWINIHEGVAYKCSSGDRVYVVPIPRLPKGDVSELIRDIKATGDVMNKRTSFNSAQGKKLSYKKLPRRIKDFYETESLRQSVSTAVGKQLFFAPSDDKDRIFARLYEDEGDFLDWHFDSNFSSGEKYTLSVPVLVDDGNTSEMIVRDGQTVEKTIKVPLGSGCIFNGSSIYHKITPQTPPGKRLAIIIPFYTVQHTSWIGKLRRKTRDFTQRVVKLKAEAVVD